MCGGGQTDKRRESHSVHCMKTDYNILHNCVHLMELRPLMDNAMVYEFTTQFKTEKIAASTKAWMKLAGK